jgi:hypothetical protein
MVDQKQVTFMDCSKVELPFGPQFVSDIVNRTHTGQNQEQALLAAELVLKAQKTAKVLTFTIAKVGSSDFAQNLSAVTCLIPSHRQA